MKRKNFVQANRKKKNFNSYNKNIQSIENVAAKISWFELLLPVLVETSHSPSISIAPTIAYSSSSEHEKAVSESPTLYPTVKTKKTLQPTKITNSKTIFTSPNISPAPSEEILNSSSYPPLSIDLSKEMIVSPVSFPMNNQVQEDHSNALAYINALKIATSIVAVAVIIIASVLLIFLYKKKREMHRALKYKEYQGFKDEFYNDDIKVDMKALPLPVLKEEEEEEESEEEILQFHESVDAVYEQYIFSSSSSSSSSSTSSSSVVSYNYSLNTLSSLKSGEGGLGGDFEDYSEKERANVHSSSFHNVSSSIQQFEHIWNDET